jgi:hypothetical protein
MKGNIKKRKIDVFQLGIGIIWLYDFVVAITTSVVEMPNPVENILGMITGYMIGLLILFSGIVIFRTLKKGEIFVPIYLVPVYMGILFFFLLPAFLSITLSFLFGLVFVVCASKPYFSIKLKPQKG